MDERMRLAEDIRRACLRLAEEAYDDAGLRGLCAEGRWEAAVGALRSADLAALLGEETAADPPQRPTNPAWMEPAAESPPSDARKIV